MKIVKLNRRFKQFKEHGHVVALRFNEYNIKARDIEATCRLKFRGGGWSRNENWYSYYGDRNSRYERDASRPYWITFRNEAELTLVLLCTDLTE